MAFAFIRIIKMKSVILVINNETYLRKFICNSLTKNNFTCIPVTTGKKAMSQLKNRYFDLVILDLDLQDINGKQILDLMRKQSIDTPVIIISTIKDIEIKIELFNTGCDDYLTKPFYMDELIVRVKRLLKRTAILTSKEREIMKDEIIYINDIELNFTERSLIKKGIQLELTKKLFEILSYFIKNSNRLITKEQIISRFWNESETFSENSLTVHIHKLRNLIEDDPSNPKYIITKRGLGYILVL